jgi:predicted NBD/HSP70 family sugar kinase
MILSLLRRNGGMSRSAISLTTGLSATTVTKAVAPLIQQGFIEEAGAETGSRVGRPAIGIQLIPSAATVCGVQIGVGFVRAALVDAAARVIRSIDFGFDVSVPAEEVLAQIAARVHDELIEPSPGILAIGVAAPGVVEADHRTNSLSINLGWHDLPIAEVFERVSGLPTAVDHNVSAMALAENRFGVGAANLAFVYVNTGVGLGLVLHDAPFSGGRHGVSELGHIHVVDEGEICSCGARGCLETIAAEPALTRQLAALGISAEEGTHPFTVIEELAPVRDDVAALRARLVDGLATGIASVVNLFSPDIVVLGGPITEAPGTFLDTLRTVAREQVFPLIRDDLSITSSTFGSDSGVVGAASVALEEFFYGVGVTTS